MISPHGTISGADPPCAFGAPSGEAWDDTGGDSVTVGFSEHGSCSIVGLVTESWTARHFSQSNPPGEGQEDVSALLRQVADSIIGLGTAEIQDIVFHNEVDAQGDAWPSMTVYFHDADDHDPGAPSATVTGRATGTRLDRKGKGLRAQSRGAPDTRRSGNASR